MAEERPAEQRPAEQQVDKGGLGGWFRRLLGRLGKKGGPRGQAGPGFEAPPQAGESPPPADSGLRLPGADSALFQLYRRQQNLPPAEDGESFDPAIFIEAGTAPEDWPEGWLERLDREAGAWLRQAEAEETPIDARPVAFVAPGGMSAWLMVLPPAYDGAPATAEQLAAALEEKGVTHGIDGEKLLFLAERHRSLLLLRVARGTPPQDGADGGIEDHFRRNMDIRLTVRDDGTIDYKDLGWLQVVYAGDVICEVIPPTEAQSGADVRGTELPGKDGKKPAVPMGQNTQMNEDGTALVAAIEGVVSFLSGKFRVDPLLIVKGDIDIGVGNLDVVGDVLVYGNVLEGFAVKATGNVTVQGLVEGATVAAGGDIQVGGGMNGNTIGAMRAGGEVRCKYLENATVAAGTRVLCDNIINSTVSSDALIEVKTGRGAIIGGAISARLRIDAKSIGNPSNRSITVTLGNSSAWLREKRELEEKLAATRKSLAELKKNVNYLSEGAQRPDEKVGLLGEMKLSLSVQQMQLATLERKLAEVSGQEVQSEDCRLRAEVIYPPAQVSIGPVTRVLKETFYNALVYLKDGDVHVANV